MKHLLALNFIIATLACAEDMESSLNPEPDIEPDIEPGIERSVHGLTGVAGVPLRYLAINVGNASPQYGCWEYKLCRSQDVVDLRNYISAWQPDVILLSEVYREAQLIGTANSGPSLCS